MNHRSRPPEPDLSGGRLHAVLRLASSPRVARCLALALCHAGGLGCGGGDDVAGQSEATTGATTSATPPSTTGSTTMTGAIEPTTAADSISTSGDPSSTDPTGACPDGDVGAGEACDDGNDVNGDGCNNDCQSSATQLWEYRSDEPGSGGIRGIAIDADASVVVGGFSGLSRWVARFSPELAPQWTQEYGGGETGIVRDVALGDGVIYAAGAHRTDADGHDVWVAGLSPDGELVWEDTLSGGLGDDWLTQATVADGDLVVAGLALSDMLWIRRYGADGVMKWTASHPIGATYKNIYPLGPGLTATPDAIVVGWSQYAMAGVPEFLVAYPHAGGAPSWTATLPGTQGNIFAIAADPGGDLALAVVDNFMALAVRRTTSTGDVLWSSTDCDGRSARDIAIDTQGDIVVIGDGPAKGGTNIRLCKFSPDGELRWGKDIDGGFGDDFGYAVAIAGDDRIVAGGSVLTGPNNSDAWLAVFSP